MIITLEEMKQYLRVDYDDDDNLIETFIAAAEKLCADVARISVDELHDICDDHIRTAVLYSVRAYNRHIAIFAEYRFPRGQYPERH